MDIAIYLLFLLWTGAGLADFALHRRSDLAHTSGLTESSLHLAQLSLMGLAVAIWWALRPTWAAWGAVAALVMMHAVVGYADTRSAWHKRDIAPLEQHVHARAGCRALGAAGLVCQHAGGQRPAAGLGSRSRRRCGCG